MYMCKEDIKILTKKDNYPKIIETIISKIN